MVGHVDLVLDSRCTGRQLAGVALLARAVAGPDLDRSILRQRPGKDLGPNDGANVAGLLLARAASRTFPVPVLVGDPSMADSQQKKVGRVRPPRAVREPVRSTSEAMEAFDGITYQKGAAVLRMLQQATTGGSSPDYAAWVGRFDGLLGYWMLPWGAAIAVTLWLTRSSWVPYARGLSTSSR